MDSSNPTPQPHISNNTNPLQFTIHLPNSNPSPNPNSVQNFNSSPNPNSIQNQLLSLSVPRKRRRGRPRNTTSALDQVYNLPSFSNNNSNVSSSNAQLSSLPSTSGQFGKPHLGSSSSDVRTSASNLAKTSPGDLSDEIIVINKEATSEALIALTAGFPADSLTDEEIDAGVVSEVGGIEQVNYILVRNHIIARWRENVSTWVTKDMFVDVIPKHCSALLDSAYSYLVSHGFINFGVAPGIKERITIESTKPKAIVIGAGLSGLAAARQLMAFGFKVTVLEGRKRAGGRVYTKKMEVGNKMAAADLGGSVLTGTLGNPLGILARQLSCTLHKVRDKCPLYRADGKPVDPGLDQKVEIAFNRILDKASKLRQLMGDVSQDVSLGAALETFRQVESDLVTEEEMNLFNWHLANLEYANAGLLSKLSLAFWDQDDPYDMGGDHCFLPGGNGRLVQALAENVPILYDRTVNTIRYDSDGVQVIAGSQVFEGDMALCTVPLGVLKNGSIKFIPELPQRKLDGIKRLGFGLLNKVGMLFPHVFWGTDLDTFGHLSNDPSSRGEFFLFYSYATVAGGPLLIALVAGEAAHKFETMPPTDAVTKVLQILKGIYEPQGIEVPEPIQTVCTRWGSDPFSFGSYSNVAVGASGDDYDILAESVGDGRLFFAGEATTRRYPATMHGALLSGFREAANMAHSARVRALRLKVEKNPSNNAHTCASILADLFREPDLEFGRFSVIFSKEDSDINSMAILRVTFSPQKKSDQQYSNKLLFQQLQSHFNQQQEFHVYNLLSKQQALELREVRGGDEMRLNHLCEKLGVKLIGRKGPGTSADSLIASIKAERGDRKTVSNSLVLKSGMPKPKLAALKQKLVKKAKVVVNGKGNGIGPSVLSTSKGTKIVGGSTISMPGSNLILDSRTGDSSNLMDPLPVTNVEAQVKSSDINMTTPNSTIGTKLLSNNSSNSNNALVPSTSSNVGAISSDNSPFLPVNPIIGTSAVGNISGPNLQNSGTTSSWTLPSSDIAARASSSNKNLASSTLNTGTTMTGNITGSDPLNLGSNSISEPLHMSNGRRALGSNNDPVPAPYSDYGNSNHQTWSGGLFLDRSALEQSFEDFVNGLPLSPGTNSRTWPFSRDM